MTFGGRVCSLLLASAGWQPGTSMLRVFQATKSLSRKALRSTAGGAPVAARV